MGAFSYTIDYAELQGEERMKKALADAKGYLGEAKVAEIISMLQAEPDKSYAWFRNCMSFLAGVSGPPVLAIWLESGRPQPTDEEMTASGITLVRSDGTEEPLK